MTKITVHKSPGNLFFGVQMSAAMHEKILELAAEKYNPVLKAFRPKDMQELIAQSTTISLIRGRSFEVGALVASVDGRNVTLSLIFNLFAFGPNSELHSLLALIRERFLSASDLEVRNGVFIGEVILPEEPYRIPTLHNGAVYFLNSEKKAALAYLAQDLALSR